MRRRWKELEGNTEKYLISDDGVVKTKSRSGRKERVLTQRENSNGYLRASLRLEGDDKSKEYLVHRLVARAFIPEIENKPFVNHKDGNKHNNSVNNLEWCSKSENERHAWATGLKTDTYTKGESHGMHKLTTENVVYIRNNHKRNGGVYSTGELAVMFSVCPQTVTDIIAGRIWKSV